MAVTIQLLALKVSSPGCVDASAWKLVFISLAVENKIHVREGTSKPIKGREDQGSISNEMEELSNVLNVAKQQEVCTVQKNRYRSHKHQNRTICATL